MIVYKGVYGFDGVYYSKHDPQFEYELGETVVGEQIYAVPETNLSYCVSFMGNELAEQIKFLELYTDESDIKQNGDIVITKKVKVIREVSYAEIIKLIRRNRK